MGVWLSVTFLIADLFQFCVYCRRSGVIRWTHLMMLYLHRMCQCGLHAVLWSLTGLLMRRLGAEPPVPPEFCSRLSIPLERSCWLRIRWCGSGGFQEQGQCFFIGLSRSIPIIDFWYFFVSLLSVYRLVLWGRGLRTDRMYITLSQPCTTAVFVMIDLPINGLCMENRLRSQVTSTPYKINVKNSKLTDMVIRIELINSRNFNLSYVKYITLNYVKYIALNYVKYITLNYVKCITLNYM